MQERTPFYSIAIKLPFCLFIVPAWQALFSHWRWWWLLYVYIYIWIDNNSYLARTALNALLLCLLPQKPTPLFREDEPQFTATTRLLLTRQLSKTSTSWTFYYLRLSRSSKLEVKVGKGCFLLRALFHRMQLCVAKKRRYCLLRAEISPWQILGHIVCNSCGHCHN